MQQVNYQTQTWHKKMTEEGQLDLGETTQPQKIRINQQTFFFFHCLPVKKVFLYPFVASKRRGAKSLHTGLTCPFSTVKVNLLCVLTRGR